MANLLSDEEIRDSCIGIPACDNLYHDAVNLHLHAAQRVAEAQHKADVEWLEEPCPHGVPDFGSYASQVMTPTGEMISQMGDNNRIISQRYRRVCDSCWQEFKEGNGTI